MQPEDNSASWQRMEGEVGRLAAGALQLRQRPKFAGRQWALSMLWPYWHAQGQGVHAWKHYASYDDHGSDWHQMIASEGLYKV